MSNDEYKDRVVRNKGKKIGKTRCYKDNMMLVNKDRLKLVISEVALITFGAGIGLGIVGTNVVNKINSKSVVVEETINDANNNLGDEPRYKGIIYNVQMGDTLSGIVYSYETDANKVEKYIDKLCEINDIDNPNSLSDRETIELYGVPSSKLEEFGYTDNYNYFAPSVELEDRLDFISNIAEKKDDNTLYVYYENLKSEYQDYKDNSLDDDDVSKLNDIFEETRDVCRYIEDEYNISFDYNKSAMPLSEALIEMDSYANK